MDDCYDSLPWTFQQHETNSVNGDSKAAPTPPPPRLVDVDNSMPEGDLMWENAISNGSFSKVFGPGMRCGWVEATAEFTKRLNEVTKTIEEYLGPLSVKVKIGRLHALIDNNTEQSLAGQVMGGFFIYILFREGIAADDVATVSLKEYNLRGNEG
ncbi:hypothetical protein TSTA_021600 [Talaromyces stipitatus ATCC 10500]|uniref:Uncharacterized protein n=1 Tax=Talaromyces stipitatus (strain ATCC 10500 / CBS 375.48 / QM 6759 / NRRL 1006) TaxID=441959 RepID=B8MHC4_TALSN|nr:uncharacterized protein TSTA_021600 [Talaromyces stipitatus ATCC 10500]EED17103.1 hypothetical protein TSTA_021600 [Talaromyces stipitatus ATCC 10500]